jgi:hypothetical protein
LGSATKERHDKIVLMPASVCHERARLLNKYSSATLALSANVEELVQKTATVPKDEHLSSLRAGFPHLRPDADLFGLRQFVGEILVIGIPVRWHRIGQSATSGTPEFRLQAPMELTGALAHERATAFNAAHSYLRFLGILAYVEDVL